MGDGGAIGDSSAESLYVQGMELFEEALQKWEQALTIRQRDSASSSTPVPWDSKKHQENLSENASEVGPPLFSCIWQLGTGGQTEC